MLHNRKRVLWVITACYILHYKKGDRIMELPLLFPLCLKLVILSTLQEMVTLCWQLPYNIDQDEAICFLAIWLGPLSLSLIHGSLKYFLETQWSELSITSSSIFLAAINCRYLVVRHLFESLSTKHWANIRNFIADLYEVVLPGQGLAVIISLFRVDTLRNKDYLPAYPRLGTRVPLVKATTQLTEGRTIDQGSSFSYLPFLFFSSW